VQQQENVDRAMNGGHLTGAERQQIGSEMHAVGQNMRGSAMQNGYSPQMMNGNGNMFGGHHQHHHMNLYNQQMNPNQMTSVNGFNGMNGMNGYNGMNGMNGYGRGYGGYPVQNGMYGQPGYGQSGQYGQNGQQGGLGNAAQMLKKLF
jgi:hypothetical protein